MHPAQVEERVKPTPETLAKRRRCSIQVLHERRVIGAEEVRAAEEIGRVFAAVTAALFARAQDLSTEGIPGRRGESWPPTLRRAHGRYVAWANHWSARHVMGGPPLLEICIDCIVDNMTCAEIDAARRWRKGRAADLIAEGLTDYATRAGWRQAAA